VPRFASHPLGKYPPGILGSTACLRLLTNTRFRRRPSRLPGQPFRLASEDPLPGAKDFGEPSADERGRRRVERSAEPSRRPLVTATTAACHGPWSASS
jgi:hypothetical protein